MSAVAEILERLEAAEVGSRELDVALGQALGLIDDALIYTYPDGSRGARGNCDPWPEWTGSLDRALALFTRTLPDWVVASMEWWPQRAYRAGVCLREVKDFEAMGGFGFGFDETCGDARANCATPALSVCAAIVRARTAIDAHSVGIRAADEPNNPRTTTETEAAG